MDTPESKSIGQKYDDIVTASGDIHIWIIIVIFAVVMVASAIVFGYYQFHHQSDWRSVKAKVNGSLKCEERQRCSSEDVTSDSYLTTTFVCDVPLEGFGNLKGSFASKPSAGSELDVYFDPQDKDNTATLTAPMSSEKIKTIAVVAFVISAILFFTLMRYRKNEFLRRVGGLLLVV